MDDILCTATGVSCGNPSEPGFFSDYALKAGDLLVTTNRTRAVEKEADVYGMYYAALAGFKPAACESLFVPGGPLAADQGKSAWLSDHPEAKDRLAALRRFADKSAPGGLKHLLAAPGGGLEVDTGAGGLRLRSMAPADEEERERVHAGHLKARALALPAQLCLLAGSLPRRGSGITACTAPPVRLARPGDHVLPHRPGQRRGGGGSPHAVPQLGGDARGRHAAGDTHPHAPEGIDKTHYKDAVASLRLPGLPGSLRQVAGSAQRGATALEAGWIAARQLVVALVMVPMLRDGLEELVRNASTAAWKARLAAQRRP